MRLVMAFDGGGTKTRCIIGDESGNILADSTTGPSNHQTVGPDETKNVLFKLYNKTINDSSIKKENISCVFLGLAGADLPEDFVLLNSICSDLFSPIPFEVVNDSWIILRSSLKQKWGAISLCGTGGNAGAIHPNGKRYILRSLSYELGGFGGGGDIASSALHYAFRSSEGTCDYTKLETYLPRLFGLKDMDELLGNLYPDFKLANDDFRKIPPLVFDLANKGDKVCQKILIDMGHGLGQLVSGVIKKLEMEYMKVPVVLGGSVYEKGSSPLLIDEMIKVVHQTAPYAYTVKPKLPPVAGAFLLGMDKLGIEFDDEKYRSLILNFNR